MTVLWRDKGNESAAEVADPQAGAQRVPFRLIAAVFTPFDDRDQLDLGAIERHCALLMACGVDGAFVCGTTGEGPLLTTEERRASIDAWIAASKGALPIVAHVGAASVQEARHLAEHAAASGASAISAVAPYYFVPGDLDSLVACCRAIADAAPELPFLYYHIPSYVRVGLPVDAFLSRAQQEIASFAGIKYTDSDLAAFARCVAVGRADDETLFGRDELLLSALELGARGAVGTTYTFMARLYRQLIAAFDAGDHEAAMACQATATAIIEIGLRFGGMAAFKVMTKWAGADCGPTRLPLAPLGREAEDEMRAALERDGRWDHLGDVR